MTANLEEQTINRIETLYRRVVDYISSARSNVIRSVNSEQLQAYWKIGRDIVEEEQEGKERANYGINLLEQLSKKLQKEFGNGFGVSTLTHIRRFYIVYQKSQKSYALRTKSEVPEFKPNLGWTHYRALIRISNDKARAFYEIEASNNKWSTRELERQIGSLLYDRLTLSKDKKELLKLTSIGQEVIKPKDAIKEPYVLEFLGIPESHKIIESALEEALVNNLQNFLLELGKGFAFIRRQQRLTIDGKHFYVDLVFYHTVLKAYVLIDLKTHEITHADLGQMQLYRNYYDMECLSGGDQPTIGLILCTEKSDKMVKYFLKDNDKIFASKYKLNLPTEKELEDEIQSIKQALTQI